MSGLGTNPRRGRVLPEVDNAPPGLAPTLHALEPDASGLGVKVAQQDLRDRTHRCLMAAGVLAAQSDGSPGESVSLPSIDCEGGARLPVCETLFSQMVGATLSAAQTGLDAPSWCVGPFGPGLFFALTSGKP